MGYDPGQAYPVRAFRTADGVYYETENGQLFLTDTEVPPKPSERHEWHDEKSLWIGSREEDGDSIAKMRLRIKDVVSLVAVIVSITGLYYGLTSKMDIQNERIQASIESIKAMEKVQTTMLDEQMDDIKHRLEVHEQRTK